MDSYTAKMRALLDERFRDFRDGIYRAHQPIYGYRKWPCEWYFMCRYIPTHRIMKVLARLRCESLLDVGGAEGYKGHIASQLFGMRVESSDLSAEACERAREIFQAKATPADIHELPFADEEFDVVICSETLEHITDPARGIEEVLRVAKKAVVITLPHESPEFVAVDGHNTGHIHTFDLNSLDYLKERGYTVASAKTMSKRLLHYGKLLENCAQLEYSEARRFPRFVYALYNRVMPLLGGRLGARVMASLVAADGLACRRTSDYAGMLFVILKDPSCWGRRRRRVSAARIMKFTVPYHYLKG